MVRFGRGYPVPRQNAILPAVSDEINTTIALASGLRSNASVGNLVVLTSEELVVAIIGVGAESAAGSTDVGIIEGATSVNALITGVEGIVSVSNLTAIGDEQGPWKKEKHRIPRRRPKKQQPFKDSYYEQGVEFLNLISNNPQYGPWWRVSTVTDDRIVLRHKTTVSSDYSIEGRP